MCPQKAVSKISKLVQIISRHLSTQYNFFMIEKNISSSLPLPLITFLPGQKKVSKLSFIAELRVFDGIYQHFSLHSHYQNLYCNMNILFLFRLTSTCRAACSGIILP
jgi:hypothetical protein